MSSTSVFSASGETPASFNRWDIPVKMGLIIGLVSIMLSTVNFMFVLPANYIAFLVFTFIAFAAAVILYGVTGARQRKAMGGYITLKEAFSAIFVAILISSIISAIWGIIYVKVIDPHVTERVKDSTLAFMERMKVPQEKLDQTATDIDKRLAGSTMPGTLLYNFAKDLVVSSIFGFICAAIVRRVPKQQMI